MGESFLRTWQDTDAPVLNASNGSFTNLLQKVLVDGYGSKPGLGWVEYFTGTNKKVFQNKGTETLVQFDHSQEANRVYVRGYESMSDIDNGVLPCPAFSKTDNYILLKTVATAPANIVPWRILGDDKGIWIWVCPGYADVGGYTTVLTGLWKAYYFGDYIPYDLTNIHHNFCWFQAEYNPPDANFGRWTVTPFASVKGSYWVRRDGDFLPGAVQAGLGAGTNYETIALGHSGQICTPDSQVQLTSIPTIHSSVFLLGRLPGLKNSLSSFYNGVSPDTYAQLQVVHPEMTFDMGNYKEHFWNVPFAATSPMYLVMTEGKGFRNVI